MTIRNVILLFAWLLSALIFIYQLLLFRRFSKAIGTISSVVFFTLTVSLATRILCFSFIQSLLTALLICSLVYLSLLHFLSRR